MALYDKARPADRVSEMLWIDYGVSVLSRQLVSERLMSGGVADLADILRDVSVEGKLAGLEVARRFYEVGSPEGLRELERHLSEGDGP